MKLENIYLQDFTESGLRFSHTNVTGITGNIHKTSKVAKLDVLMTHNFMLVNSILIMSVCETHLREGVDISRDNHCLVNWVPNNRGGGTAAEGTGVFIHRSIEFSEITPIFRSCSLVKYLLETTAI